MADNRRATRVALLIAVVAVVGIAWLVLRTGTKAKAPESQQAPAMAQATQSELTPTRPSTRETVAQPSVTAPTEPVTSAPAPAQVFGGRVLLKEDSSPVANVVVKISLAQGGTWLDTKTDAQGAFRFALDKPNGVRSLRVPATPTTTALLLWANEAFPNGATTERTFYVTRGATLSGVVVDRSGAPVVGADVSGWCTENYPKDAPPDRTTTSDAGGRFTLEHIGDSFFVAASARDQCCARGLRGKLVPGTNAEGLQVVVAPCVTMRGHVVDDAGFALAGAKLRMDGASSSSSRDNTSVPGVSGCDWGAADVTCSADGGFEITGLAGPSLRRNAWCEHETCVGDHQLVDSDVADNRLVLKRGVQVTGIVRLHDGAPAANAAVTFGHVGGKVRKVTTRSDGTFTAGGVSPEPKTIVRVRLQGAAIYAGNFVIETGVAPIEIRLEPARAIAGVVIDDEKKPVPYAKVHIEGDRMVEYEGFGYGEPTTLEFAHDMNRVLTDAAGRFRFDDLYDGSFEVRATDPAGTNGQGKVVSRSGVEDLVVAFDASTTVILTGRVVDDATGEPIRDFRLTCMKPAKGDEGSWNGTAKNFSAADGRFRYGGIDAGKTELYADADGYAHWSTGEQDYAAGKHELDVRMSKLRTLSLQVVRADGKPFQNGSITATDADGNALKMITGPGSSTSRIHVSRDPVQIAGLPAKTVTIHVHLQEETFDFDFDLRAPILSTQTVVVKPAPEPPEVGLTVTLIDSRVTTTGKEPPFVQEDWELILEDAKGQRLAKIDVKPTAKGFEITQKTGNLSWTTTYEQAVVHLGVRTTVATAKLSIGTREPVTLTVPAPGPDGTIFWPIDVSKL